MVSMISRLHDPIVLVQIIYLFLFISFYMLKQIPVYIIIVLLNYIVVVYYSFDYNGVGYNLRTTTDRTGPSGPIVQWYNLRTTCYSCRLQKNGLQGGTWKTSCSSLTRVLLVETTEGGLQGGG